MAGLKHADKNARIETALELGKVADLQAVPALLERVGTEPDFFMREHVTWAVVRLGDAAVRPLIAIRERGDTAERFSPTRQPSALSRSRR